jgi:isoleucyl-tRNA synthetase
MIADRPDWCISRQRFWGVPLIIFNCEGCGEILRDFQALRHVLPFFEREGADAWFTHTAEELLPPGTKCAKCGAAKWQKEKDVLDVWFDSGSSNLAVLSQKDGTWPADVYMEGPDQYRGWFHSSLLVAMGVRGSAPYREVVTHGWTLDEKGQPMSKSLGNVMEPNEITKKWGADLLRVWVCSQDYTSDVRLSEAMMTQLAEAYRKIRNTFRFALSNLYDFDPARDAVADSELLDLDAYMLRRTGALVKQCRDWYLNYEFHRVYHALHDFCTVDLSAFYFDVLKDRLYTFAPRSLGRRSAQTAMYRIASALLRLIAPTLVFTSEEIWKFMPAVAAKPESVHMTEFPSADQFNTLDAERAKNWDRLILVREEVLKALEPLRAAKTISSALEARVTLGASGNLLEVLRKNAAFLPGLFIVSQVEVAEGKIDGASPAPSMDGLQIKIDRALGTKCERCWNYSTHVGENADYPTVCERCVAALSEIERERPAGEESAA